MSMSPTSFEKRMQMSEVGIYTVKDGKSHAKNFCLSLKERVARSVG